MLIIKDSALLPYVVGYDFNGFSVGEEDSPKHREWKRTEGLQGAIQYIVSRKLAAIDRTVTLAEFRKIEEDLRNDVQKALEPAQNMIVADEESKSSLTIKE